LASSKHPKAESVSALGGYGPWTLLGPPL